MTMSLAEARDQVTHHLARAERGARAWDVSGLDPLRRLVRRLLLDELAWYRGAGRFPQNPDHAAPTPYFVDAAQTPCAVAHLLQMTGERALVQRIARERNHARVRELANEPRLVSWLTVVGLSLEEAAAIQPTYPTTIERAACVCGGEVSFSSEIQPFGPLPAQGVIVGTALDVLDSKLRVRIDAAHGDIAPYAVGEEIVVEPVADGVNSPAVDRTVVVAVHAANDAGVGPAYPGQDGGALSGVVLAEDDTYSCTSADLKLGPVTEEQLVKALRVDACKDYLASLNWLWGQSVHRGDEVPFQNCALRPGSESTAELSSLSVLLVLVSSIVARRARAR